MSQFDVGPGDMLFLPVGWYHQVTTWGAPHMAVNFWGMSGPPGGYGGPHADAPLLHPSRRADVGRPPSKITMEMAKTLNDPWFD